MNGIVALQQAIPKTQRASLGLFRRPVATRQQIFLRTAAPNIQSDGVHYGATSQIQVTVETACRALQLGFTNFYNNSGTEASNPNAITVRAALLLTTGAYVPLTFGGQPQVLIQPDGQVLTDPLGIEFAKGATFKILTYVALFSGEVFPRGMLTDGVNEGNTWDADYTAAGAISIYQEYVYAPTSILGVPVQPLASPVVVVDGDSISAGYADTVLSGTGHWRQALEGKFSMVNLSLSGGTANQTRLAERRRRRQSIADLTNPSVAIVALGRNDLAGAMSAATLQTYLTTIYQKWKDRGCRVFGATITPDTTSTDQWVTTGNQTTSSFNAARITVNDWIRTTPAPLDGYFELADTVETARNSGIWKVNGTAFGITQDGTHPSGGYALMAAGIDPTRLGAQLTS